MNPGLRCRLRTGAGGCIVGALALACSEEPARYPQPTYVDYTQQYPPAGSPPSPPGPPAPVTTSAPAAAAAPTGPTIGDALAPFGIVLPPNISLLQLPPPSAWQNWPFTWPNLPPQQPPAPPQAGGAPPPAAAPNAPPSTVGTPAGWTPEEAIVLDETNRRRAAGARCGSEQLPPAPPLAANAELGRSARGHSADMARQNYFDHTSLDGRSVEQRTRGAGFPGGFVGENIAAGRADPRATVQQWMDSPGHCLNIMEPRYRFLGVGHASNPNTQLNHFWTQNFGG